MEETLYRELYPFTFFSSPWDLKSSFLSFKSLPQFGFPEIPKNTSSHP